MGRRRRLELRLLGWPRSGRSSRALRVRWLAETVSSSQSLLRARPQ